MTDTPKKSDKGKADDKPAKKPAAKKPAAKAADTKKAAADKPAAKKPAAKKPAAKKEAPAKEAAVAAPVADALTPEQVAAAAAKSKRTSGEATSQPTRAVATYLRFSARKGRLVADQIRGRTVVDAATLLAFNERAAAREVMKVLKSAVANAENNNGMTADELYVSAAFVDEGPTFKRWKPRARGRADKIAKRTCHVTVIVDNAPIELLEGRKGKSGGASASRSARVAASKQPAKKPAEAKKPSTKKPARKADADAPKAKAPAKAAPAKDESATDGEQQ
jgi:large subunit ribosomal protein L22